MSDHIEGMAADLVPLFKKSAETDRFHARLCLGDGTGTLVAVGTARPRSVWINFDTTQGRQQTTAVLPDASICQYQNNPALEVPNPIEVWVGKRPGENWLSVLGLYGVAGQQATSGDVPVAQAINQAMFPGNGNLADLQVQFRGTDGPYAVYIAPGTYADVTGADTYWSGVPTLDLTPVLTVVSGQHQWVKIGLDITNHVPIAIAGTPVSLAIPLGKPDLASINFEPNLPLAGVVVAFGVAIGSQADIVDCSFVKSPASLIKRTATATNYSMNANDLIVGVTSTAAARTITLPPIASVAVGQPYVVKDESGGAATHNITVQGASGNIDGAGSKAISTNYGSIRAYTDGTNWFTI